MLNVKVKGSRESTESKLNVECESKGSRESTESKPTTVENIEFPADAFHMVTQVLFFSFLYFFNNKKANVKVLINQYKKLAMQTKLNYTDQRKSFSGV